MSLALAVWLISFAAPALSSEPDVEDVFAPFSDTPFEAVALREREEVATVQQPNWSQLPVFDEIGTPGYFGSALRPPGEGVESVAVGEGPGAKPTVYLATAKDNRVHAYDAVDPGPQLFSFGSGTGPEGLRDAAGIAYWRGEVYVVDRSRASPEQARVVVYDSAGNYQRQIALLNPLGKVDMTGVDVGSGEVWVTGSLCGGFGSVIEIFDARTGLIKGIVGHLAHAPTGDLSQLCNESYDPSAWWDLAVVPELDASMAGYRLVKRGLVAALSTPDPELLCYFCFRRLWQDGIDGVWGMRWLLSVDGAGRTSRGTAITEYSFDANATTGDPYLTERRRWLPKQTASGGVRDVHYQNREVRVDWDGNLTESDWINHDQELDYIVSDADIYAVGDQGERWYELARNFDHIELEVDGVNHPFSVDGAAAANSSTKPYGRLSFDTHRLASGTHRLELIAYLKNGQQAVATNDALRIDHTPPTGRLDAPGYAVRGTVALTGDLADEHRGPKDWRPQVTRSGQGSWGDICGIAAPGPYTCAWDTTRHPDGWHDLRAGLNDLMVDRHDNPAHTPTTSTIVDNNAPTFGLSGSLVDVGYFPLQYGQPESLDIGAGDGAGSGIASIEVRVDGVQRQLQSFGCTTGGCSRSAGFTFWPEQYGEGVHTVEVVVRDHVGFESRQSFQRDVEAPPAETPDTSASATAAPSAAPPGALAQDIAPEEATELVTGTTDELLQCTGVQQQLNFIAYSLGSSFEGLPVTALLRDCELPYPGEPGRANHVTYVYGDCVVAEPADGGCAPPLEVQTWPACERNLAEYYDPAFPAEYSRTTVRGVPAASFEGGTRFELYAGGSTIVIFGEDPEQVRRAADSVVADPSGQPPTVPATNPTAEEIARPLPEPFPGAMTGALSCLAQLEGG